MSSCATCRHWIPPTEREGYGNVVRFDPGRWASTEERTALYAAADEADKLYGRCAAITLQTDLPFGEPVPLAVAMDGSEYKADLYTQAEFFCAMWETRTDDAAETAQEAT